MTDTRRAAAQVAAPWDEPPARERAHGRTGSDRSWQLSIATVAVLAAGYGWLGEVAGGATGAVIGSLVGLAVSGLLYLVVNRATSGRPPAR
ncbi:hypothetical protein [Streptomyces sp. NBC_01615]|uniref:hypothetical protein n=1 Tax=Streptomyces sp. NBC_01615 TaxID=2975898 RepID=UPI0038662CEB